MPLTFSIHHLLVLTSTTSGNIFSLARYCFWVFKFKIHLAKGDGLCTCETLYFPSPNRCGIVRVRNHLNSDVRRWSLWYGTRCTIFCRWMTWGARCKVSRGIVMPSDIVIVQPCVEVSSDVEMYGYQSDGEKVISFYRWGWPVGQWSIWYSSYWRSLLVPIRCGFSCEANKSTNM